MCACVYTHTRPRAAARHSAMMRVREKERAKHTIVLQLNVLLCHQQLSSPCLAFLGVKDGHCKCFAFRLDTKRGERNRGVGKGKRERGKGLGRVCVCAVCVCVPWLQQQRQNQKTLLLLVLVFFLLLPLLFISHVTACSANVPQPCFQSSPCQLLFFFFARPHKHSEQNQRSSDDW